MAGRGPSPKPSDQRVRGARSEPHGLKVIHAEATPQPKLPSLRFPNSDGKLVQVAWPAQTRTWWAMWGDSPLSADFTATDWSELLDTALLHARFWRGDHKVAAELRLRVAKFGATPEDRARLRITFAQADDAESKGDAKPKRDRVSAYQGLRVVGDSGAVAGA